MKKIRHYKNLENLLNRHPAYDLYHPSIGLCIARRMHEYAPAHNKPVTIKWNATCASWDIVRW